MFAAAARVAGVRRGHLSRPEQLQARQRHVRPRGGRRGAADRREPAHADAASLSRRSIRDADARALRRRRVRHRAARTRSSRRSECRSPRLATKRSSSRSTTTRSSSTRRRASAWPCIPDDGADVATVFKHADTAMYQAKSGAAGAGRHLHAGDEQPPARLAGARSAAAPRRPQRSAAPGVPAEVPPERQPARRRRSAAALARRRVRRHLADPLRRDRRGQRPDPRHERMGGARRVPPVAQVARPRLPDSRGDQLLGQGAAARRPGARASKRRRRRRACRRRSSRSRSPSRCW